MLLNYLPVIIFAVFILYEIKISGNKAAFYFFLILYIIVFAIIVPYLTLSLQQSFNLENIIGKKEILNNQIWFMIFFSIPVFLKVRKNVER